ncbi:MAG: glycoside hydrolase family 3 C-terminal domain-containing protein [Dehalococcoidales bacterium]
MQKRIEALIKQMTLEEKVSLLAGINFWRTHAIERLGIPSIKVTDGPHGARTVDETNNNVTIPATCFPTAVGMAATWNPDLIYQVGSALGEETRARGCSILLGPCVNIHRSPLGGRNFESYSEDPYLSARMGVAIISGIQSRKVSACVKHFALNNSEYQRMTISSEADERTMREIYFPSFEKAIKEAGVWSFMCSYNKVNGTHASENHRLLTEILKDEWGFAGLVMSDWFATHSTVPAANAGLDLEMPGPARFFGEALVKAVKEGEVDIKIIDDKVRRILRILINTGALEGNINDADKNKEFPAHGKLAREIAEEAIVLLKNDNHILPLDKSKIKTIAVIGPNAASASIQGGGSAQVVPYYKVAPLEAIKNLCGDNMEIVYAPGCDASPSPDLLERAVKAAANADAAIVFAGLNEKHESEGFDRKDMDLPPGQNELISRVAKANPNTVVVLNNGSPLAMPWLENVPAVVEAFFPGQECGNAIASVLFGLVNPSGKLPDTFPHRLEDNPAFANYPGANDNVLYGEGIYVGYRHYDANKVEPLFPFGYGLSYTSFEYSNLKVSPAKAKDKIKVSVDITNTGKVAGKEVVQVYVADVACSVPRPPKELKAFKKVALSPGEKKIVNFTLTKEAFSFYDVKLKDWVAEPGDFEILVGNSSRDIRVKGKFTLLVSKKH